MTQTTIDTSASEYARVSIPSPSCELVMGSGPDAFVGVRLVTDTGQAFLSAGASYRDAAQTAAIFGTVFAALPVAFGLTRFSLGGAGSELLGVGLGAAFTMLSGLSATLFLSGSGSPGNTLVYGKNGVTLATPGAASLYGASFVSVTSGLFASVNGGVASSVFGVLGASLGGGLSATVSAMAATVEGQASARLASQRGDVVIEGAQLFVGRRSVSLRKGVSAVRRRAFGKSRQAPTKSIALEAEEKLTVEVGAPVGGADAPVRFAVLPTGIVAQSKFASISLGTDPAQGSVEVAAGASAIHVARDALTLGRLAGSPSDTRATNQADAKTARDTAVNEAEASAKVGLGFLAPVVVGGATAYGVAALAGAGLPMGAAAGLTATTLAFEVATSLARKKADNEIAVAEKAYGERLVDTQATFEQAVRDGLTQPGARPFVRIDATSVVIQVGTSTVTIKDGEIAFSAKLITASAQDLLTLASEDGTSLEGKTVVVHAKDLFVRDGG